MRMQLLHRLIEFGVAKTDLVNIYVLFIRSLCEQSPVVWHSGLTEENRNNIERVQKTALKIILRNEYTTYEAALRKTDLKSLDERRKTLCLNFAKGCLKNPLTSDMFPLNERGTTPKTRFTEKFKVYHANTERLKNSPIIYMQNLLNEDHRRTID